MSTTTPRPNSTGARRPALPRDVAMRLAATEYDRMAEAVAALTPEHWDLPTWMHRTDLASATGLPMYLTCDHDGRIVDDVVREWAGRHGRAYRLELTGPAGGHWSAGESSAAETISMGAIEFCRIISGRGSASGLLTTQVPF